MEDGNNKGGNLPRLMKLETHTDERGYLVPLTNKLNDELGKPIKRTYVVGNFSKGTVRGLHYHEEEIKVFFVVKGSAKFVVINPNNALDKHSFVLSSRSHQLVIVPPMYANGWVSLEDDTILVSLSTSTFEESTKDDKRYDPYQWGDVWTIKAR